MSYEYSSLNNNSSNIQKLTGWFSSLYVDKTPVSEKTSILTKNTINDTLLNKFLEIDREPKENRERAAAALTPEMITNYVQMGADVNATNDKLETPLHLAAKLHRSDLLAKLLSHGAKVNVQDDKGYTPLHRVAISGHLPNIQMLLENKANANIQCEELTRRVLALHLACQYGHFEVVKQLLPATDNPLAETSDGYSALHFAAASGSEEIGAYLLEKCTFSLTAKTGDGYTPLSIAAHYKKTEFGNFLTKKLMG